MSYELHIAIKKGCQPRNGADYLWSLMRAAPGREFTVRDLAGQSNAKRDTIRSFVRRLEAAGILASQPRPGGSVYRLVRDQLETPKIRRDGTIEPNAGAAQCLWNAIRNAFKQGFEPRDLAHFASTDEVRISIRTALDYCRDLDRAGYLIPLNDVRSRSRDADPMWRLDPRMNTGPRAPLILKTRLVYDPNRGDIVGAAQAEAVLA